MQCRQSKHIPCGGALSRTIFSKGEHIGKGKLTSSRSGFLPSVLYVMRIVLLFLVNVDILHHIFYLERRMSFSFSLSVCKEETMIFFPSLLNCTTLFTIESRILKFNAAWCYIISSLHCPLMCLLFQIRRQIPVLLERWTDYFFCPFYKRN